MLVFLALFPVLAAIAELASDFVAGLPTDHQATFGAVAGQPGSDGGNGTSLGQLRHPTRDGYAIHELVVGILFLVIVAIPLRRGQWWAWWLAWVVLVADLGYTFTFGAHDTTVFSRALTTVLSRALIADIALPVLLLAHLPWLLSTRNQQQHLPG